MFAALDDPGDASALYYSFALIYATPYLANGFQLDAFSLVVLGACALHVQVGAAGWWRDGGPWPLVLVERNGEEYASLCCMNPSKPTPPSTPLHLPTPLLSQVERVAQTEPLELELPELLRGLLGALQGAVRGLGRGGERLGGAVGSRTRSAEEARQRRPDRWGAAQPAPVLTCFHHYRFLLAAASTQSRELQTRQTSFFTHTPDLDDLTISCCTAGGTSRNGHGRHGWSWRISTSGGGSGSWQRGSRSKSSGRSRVGSAGGSRKTRMRMQGGGRRRRRGTRSHRGVISLLSGLHHKRQLCAVLSNACYKCTLGCKASCLASH